MAMEGTVSKRVLRCWVEVALWGRCFSALPHVGSVEGASSYRHAFYRTSTANRAVNDPEYSVIHGTKWPSNRRGEEPNKDYASARKEGVERDLSVDKRGAPHFIRHCVTLVVRCRSFLAFTAEVSDEKDMAVNLCNAKSYLQGNEVRVNQRSMNVKRENQNFPAFAVHYGPE